MLFPELETSYLIYIYNVYIYIYIYVFKGFFPNVLSAIIHIYPSTTVTNELCILVLWSPPLGRCLSYNIQEVDALEAWAAEVATSSIPQVCLRYSTCLNIL